MRQTDISILVVLQFALLLQITAEVDQVNVAGLDDKLDHPFSRQSELNVGGSTEASQSVPSNSEAFIGTSESAAVTDVSVSDESLSLDPSQSASADQSSSNASQSTNRSQPQPAQALSARSKRRFNCSHRSVAADDESEAVMATVTLIDSSDFTELREALMPPSVGLVESNSSSISNNSSAASNQSQCAVLLYYLTYCPYSVALAPHFNALSRAFPGLHFFAAEADKVSPFYANYTTSMAPQIRIYRDREFIGVNTSVRTLDLLIAELANITGHRPVPNVTLTDADSVGPVPTVLAQPFDYWLILSCLYFVVFLLPWLATKSPRLRIVLARFGANLARLFSAGGVAAHPHAD